MSLKKQISHVIPASSLPGTNKQHMSGVEARMHITSPALSALTWYPRHLRWNATHATHANLHAKSFLKLEKCQHGFCQLVGNSVNLSAYLPVIKNISYYVKYL